MVCFFQLIDCTVISQTNGKQFFFVKNATCHYTLHTLYGTPVNKLKFHTLFTLPSIRLDYFCSATSDIAGVKGEEPEVQSRIFRIQTPPLPPQSCRQKILGLC